MDAFVSRPNIRRILVLNHVTMDETRDMTLRDHIKLIETVATENASHQMLERIGARSKRLPISDLFSDVVIPRTVAREVEADMARSGFQWDQRNDDKPVFAQVHATDGLSPFPFCGITQREMQVLSYLEQPAKLYRGRTEAERYRDALFATEDDIIYLLGQGIQRRSIHEIESIGENWKLLKTEGAASFEFLPGLVPEALVGIPFALVVSTCCESGHC